MSECQQCGRELPSHHLGCAAAGRKSEATAGNYDELPQPDPEVESDEVAGDESAFDGEQAVCAADGCQDAPKPYAGRGPRPKFCAAHSSGKGK